MYILTRSYAKIAHLCKTYANAYLVPVVFSYLADLLYCWPTYGSRKSIVQNAIFIPSSIVNKISKRRKENFLALKISLTELNILITLVILVIPRYKGWGYSLHHLKFERKWEWEKFCWDRQLGSSYRLEIQTWDRRSQNRDHSQLEKPEIAARPG